MEQPHIINEVKTDEVFVISYRIYISNLRTIILYVLTVLVPLNLAHFFLTPKEKAFYGEDSTVSLSILFESLMSSGTALGMFVSALISAFAFIAFAGIMYAASESYRGRHASFPQTLKPALKYFAPMAIMFGIFLLLWMLGMALLVLPGLFFLVYFSMFLPAMAAEGRNWFDSFRASYVVSKPQFWRLLVFWILWTLMFLVFNVIFQMMVQQFAEDIIPYMIINFIAQILLMYLAIPPTVQYLNLSDIKKSKEARGLAEPLTKWYTLP